MSDFGGPAAPPACGSQGGDCKWLVSSVTLVVGLAIVSFLTLYNSQASTVWAMFGEGPVRTWEEYLIVNIGGLVLLPVLAIYSLPRGEPGDFGLRRPAPGSAATTTVLYALMLPVLLIASRLPVFGEYYPMQAQAATSLPYLVYFEATYGLYMLCWEWFFRGFLTFGAARAFGWTAAIALQAVAFGVMHLGKPWPEFVGSFVAGAALGCLARRSRSFFPCFALHWACSVTFDLFVIRATPGGLF